MASLCEWTPELVENNAAQEVANSNVARTMT